MKTTPDPVCILTIFGGTGDLTHRKLMPALYNLTDKHQLPDNIAVVAVGRQQLSEEEYRKSVYQSIKKFSRSEVEEDVWNSLRDNIYYHRMDFNSDDGYTVLNQLLMALDEKYGTNGNRIYYLAVAPEYFPVIVNKLHTHEMGVKPPARRRIMIEKPFGRDLTSARALNQEITKVFSEQNIYRIDHYLGKQMIQNIMVIRFANILFESVWNSRYIDSVQITSSETIGVQNRGSYYEQAGALRDMIQNHMLQLLTMVAMEAPANLDAEAIRDEKVKILKSLEPFSAETARRNVVRGQYSGSARNGRRILGYREEAKVATTSQTETFIALKARISNFRWAGVPFYIRTGKRLPAKLTEIVIQFKKLPEVLYAKEPSLILPANILIIKIQPQEGVYFKFNAKEPGMKNKIVPVNMDFCQNCESEEDSPEAYEKLLLDAINEDSTLFTRWDEVENAWSFTDSIVRSLNEDSAPLYSHPAGTWGPDAADDLLSYDDRKWWNGQ